MLKRGVKIKIDNSYGRGTLTVDTNEIIFEFSNIKISKQGEYPFMILKDIRQELEKKNILILINGSRIDVYPSGMSLVGITAYIQRFGKQAFSDDLVDIFDETDEVELIGSVSDQIKYHRDWISSLGG